MQDDIDRIVSLKEEAISLKEKEIETLKESYDTAMRLNKQSTDCVKNLEADLEKVSQDYNSLHKWHICMQRVKEEVR